MNATELDKMEAAYKKREASLPPARIAAGTETYSSSRKTMTGVFRETVYHRVQAPFGERLYARMAIYKKYGGGMIYD
jgi:hypothetical protein